jgi:hypothetical protein
MMRRVLIGPLIGGIRERISEVEEKETLALMKTAKGMEQSA